MIDLTNYKPHMLPKVRSEDIMSSMAYLPCTLRLATFIPGLGCAHDDTVVGCHLPVWGKGIHTKVTDMAVAAGCSRCHDLIDARDQRWEWLQGKYPVAILERMLCGLTETHALLIDRGVIEIPDAIFVGNMS